MKRIPLTQGQFAIVDDKDFDWLNQYKWCAYWRQSTKSFYAMRNSKKKNSKRPPIWMAREILGLKHGDKQQADHINHTTLDNRNLNLRVVTPQENMWNPKNPRGYYWNKSARKYRAQIGIGGANIYLGSFSTAEEARSVYLRAKEKYHRFKVAS